jgi:hypothetical protein
MDTSTVGIKIFKMMVLLGVITLFGANIVIAGTYYVSNSGSASWASAISTNTPCSVATSFANAKAGDTVYFRGGTYNVPAKNSGSTYVGYYNPSNSGTGNADSNRIIFKAYPSETPIFNGTAGGSGDVAEFATIFGTCDKDYITFDGFTFQSDGGTKMARVIFWANTGTSDYITIKNCTLNGGSTIISSTDNREGLRVEDATNVVIQNCKIYNYLQTNNNHNTSGLKFYHDSNITIENCEIYNCSTGIFYKSAVDTAITRYNYIHNCNEGIDTTPWESGYDMPNHSYYHNVIANCTYTGLHIYMQGNGTANNLIIYNNTIYSTVTNVESYGIFVGISGGWTASNSQRFYNNIIQGAKYKVTFCPGVISECDYNQYGSSGLFNIRANYTAGTRTNTSLSSWQTSTEVSGGSHPDTHGLASNPVFLNSSGSYSQLADFKLSSRSPCKSTGKSGGDMGANIDLVGVSISPSQPTGDTTAPTTPIGVSISIIQ